jgi:O-antigen ligase
MTRQEYTFPERLSRSLAFAVVALVLVALHQIPVPVVLAIAFVSIIIGLYRPITFVYLLIASTLFVPEIPVGPGISLNVLLMTGFGLTVLKEMTLTQTWTLPEPQYASIVFLLGIVGLLSLFKAFAYFDVGTIAFGALYFGQWFLYLLLPVLMTFYLRGNPRHITGVLSFTLFISAVIALYLLGLFLFDIRPVETTIRIAGHRPLVAFWQQGNLAVGMFTSLTSLLAVGLAIKERREQVTAALVGLAALCAFLTMATLSRSAILGLVIGVFTVLLLEYRWKTVFVVTVAAPLAVLLAPEWLIIRFTRSTFFWREVPALGIEIPIGTLWKRVNGWAQLSRVFLHNPLFGIGFSLSQERMAQLLEARVSPDNHYVALLVETGIAGFTVFCLWVRVVFWRLFESYREAASTISGLGLGMLGAFTALLVWGFFQGFYARWRILGPLFIYIGLIYAAHERFPSDEQN